MIRTALSAALVLGLAGPASAQTLMLMKGIDAPHYDGQRTTWGPTSDIVNMFQNDPRYNRGKTPEQIKDGVEFVTGNVLFVLAHETGHALISVFDLPVLGREEDAGPGPATAVGRRPGSARKSRRG